MTIFISRPAPSKTGVLHLVAMVISLFSARKPASRLKLMCMPFSSQNPFESQKTKGTFAHEYGLDPKMVQPIDYVCAILCYGPVTIVPLADIFNLQAAKYAAGLHI